MLDKILTVYRSAVRPTMILALGLTWIAAAASPLVGADPEDAKLAVAALGPPAALMFQAWFSERSAK